MNYELRMLLRLPRKPILIWNFNKENLKTQVELCAAAVGGMDVLLEKPFIIAGGAASVPLSHGEDTLDKLLYMFELGLPTPYIAATMMGVYFPVTLADLWYRGFVKLWLDFCFHN